jgi:hypothetical protein
VIFILSARTYFHLFTNILKIRAKRVSDSYSIKLSSNLLMTPLTKIIKNSNESPNIISIYRLVFIVQHQIRAKILQLIQTLKKTTPIQHKIHLEK